MNRPTVLLAVYGFDTNDLTPTCRIEDKLKQAIKLWGWKHEQK